MSRSLALLLVATSCSSGEVGSKPVDGGVAHDAHDASDSGAPDTADGLASCGGTPSFRYLLKALVLQKDESSSPLAGATLSFDTCPGVTATTDAQGLATINVRRGVPFVARVTAPGDMTVLFGETLIAVNDPRTELKTATLVPVLPAPTSLPWYSPTEPLLVVDILANGKCGPAGMSVSVVGHPEANMHCMLSTWPSDATEPTICVASWGPILFFTGLSGGSTVQLAASGCAGATTVGAQTGNFPLENGVLTVANVNIP